MKQYKSNKAGGEMGQAMLEFCIVLPVIMMILVSTFELGRALTQYLSLSRIAYEGARYAASLPGLEEGNFDGEGDTVPNYHHQVWDAIDTLLQQNRFDKTEKHLSTEHKKDATDVNGLDGDKVRIAIEMPYTPMFASFLSNFPSLTIRVEATGPYLYPNKTVS